MTVDLSTSFVDNALGTVHQRIVAAQQPVSTDALLATLEAKGWHGFTRQSLSQAMMGRPQWFRPFGDDEWQALGGDYSGALRLSRLRVQAQEEARALKEPVAFASGGGGVWHVDLECSGLWDGKAKAASEGKNLHPISVEPRSSIAASRPACRICANS